ncbi:MAG: META domain-containing protein [Gammaproteobacteria bacterium]|nr:META domain-containing protein [Gammaproteobacteria bacterium]
MNARPAVIAAALLSLAISAACTPQGAPPRAATGGTASLDGTGWILATLDGQPPVAGQKPTVRFETGSLSGTDGCNRYSGPYTATDTSLTVDSNLAATQMACAEPVMQQSATFTGALRETRRYVRERHRLSLLAADGRELATFDAQPGELSGTAWTVTGYNNGRQAVVSVATGSNLTLAFGDDGRITGSAGCNSYTATFLLADDTIKVGPAAATRMMCSTPDGVMKQEALFLQALQSAATYRLEAERLELRTASGALALSMTGVLSERTP